MKYTSEFPLHRITVDTIVYDRENQLFLLGKRLNEPFQDQWCNFGGFFNPEDDEERGIRADASVEAAAWRELSEEANINVRCQAGVAKTAFLDIYDDRSRHPDYRAISAAYWVSADNEWYENIEIQAGDDIGAVDWFSVEDALRLDLAFDHAKMITDFWHNIVGRNLE